MISHILTLAIILGLQEINYRLQNLAENHQKTLLIVNRIPIALQIFKIKNKKLSTYCKIWFGFY